MGSRVRLGVDIGGTFTDIVAVDGETGRYEVLKVPSTPNDYMVGIKRGLERLFAKRRWHPGDVEVFFHGTTVATNTLIEKKGARTGLLTTTGFRDVLEVGRTDRPPADLYNLFMTRPEPLVPRRLRIGVSERVRYTGEEAKPLDESATREAVERLLDMGIESLAISFINAHANPAHEIRAREIAREVRSELFVAISSDVNPQIKEFERTSTTVLGAYVGPRVSRYVAAMKTMLTKIEVRSPAHIMQASGGAMSVDSVAERAHCTIQSGPAAGVLGAQAVGEMVGEPDFVSFDMGGTSTDVSLVRNGQYSLVEETEEAGYHLRIPMIDIVSIGAGGGSLAWIDSGGLLKVGPESAGADPGPACFGTGDKPTVTDANVVLGYIDPDFFLGGEINLDADRSRWAIENGIAKQLGIETVEAASGIVRVANANMIRAIKRITIERGHDVRDFSLIPAGGAGPLHGGRLLVELAMRCVVIPVYPGVLSACGLVEADLEYQHVQTILTRLDEVNEEELREYFELLERRGLDDMTGAGVALDDLVFERFVNVRYRSQVRQMTVELGSEPVSGDWIRHRFLEEHERLFGYFTDDPIEVVDVRVACVRRSDEEIVWSQPAIVNTEPSVAFRNAYFEEENDFVECPVYSRTAIKPGITVQGPAIVQQEETNTVVRPGQTLEGHKSGSMFIFPDQSRPPEGLTSRLGAVRAGESKGLD